ncbi:hypothetical protein PDIDSM_5157 [Penicillium digitatum]|nr:hypothetical protein PDIDSM_5157 [Penicillium digitatum]
MVRYLPFFASLAAATNLYATHYDGEVYTLSLEDNSLSITSSSKTCGTHPSWLTFDSSTRTIYCSDHAGNSSMNGLLTSYSVNQDGSMTELTSTVDVGAARWFCPFDLCLTLKSGEEPLQVFHYKMAHPGIRPEQEAPHPHQVILDPTGDFILVPDLGADQVRVYGIDHDSGHLNLCPSLNYTAGSGPRHGLFWKSSPSQSDQVPLTMLYTVSELARHFNAFEVSYLSSGCLGFKETQAFVPYPGGQLPAKGTPAEIRMAGDNLYASIRFDQGFAPNDSISTLVRSPDGTVSFSQITSAYGAVPRTFAINNNGTLVAIAGQDSSNVAIVERDPQSGKLGNLVANVPIVQPGQDKPSSGLSSIIWEE